MQHALFAFEVRIPLGITLCATRRTIQTVDPTGADCFTWCKAFSQLGEDQRSSHLTPLGTEQQVPMVSNLRTFPARSSSDAGWRTHR